MDNKKTSNVRTVIAYILLIFLAFLCLFFFYILIINSTRNHFQIQRGFSFIPGSSFMKNLKNVLKDANIPVLSGIKNSLIVSVCSAGLATYFSALTAYGLYAYEFKLKKTGIYLHYADPGHANTGFCTGFHSVDYEDEFDEYIDSVIPSIHCRTVCILFHA